MTSVRTNEPPFWAGTVYEWVFAHLPKSLGGRIVLAATSFCVVAAIVLSLVLMPLLVDDVDEPRLEAFGYIGVFIASLATSFILLKRFSSSPPLWRLGRSLA